MSTALEQIVRPFVSTISLTTQRIIAKNKTVNSEPVLIAWGQTGLLPTPTLDPGVPGAGFKVEECNDNFTEQKSKRKTHDQTITDDASGASVTFTITDNIVFSKAPADAKNVGSLRTETTSFSVIDPFAGTAFGDVSKSNQCNSSFALDNTAP